MSEFKQKTNFKRILIIGLSVGVGYADRDRRCW